MIKSTKANEDEKETVTVNKVEAVFSDNVVTSRHSMTLRGKVLRYTVNVGTVEHWNSGDKGRSR